MQQARSERPAYGAWTMSQPLLKSIFCFILPPAECPLALSFKIESLIYVPARDNTILASIVTYKSCS